MSEAPEPLPRPEPPDDPRPADAPAEPADAPAPPPSAWAEAPAPPAPAAEEPEAPPTWEPEVFPELGAEDEVGAGEDAFEPYDHEPRVLKARLVGAPAAGVEGDEAEPAAPMDAALAEFVAHPQVLHSRDAAAGAALAARWRDRGWLAQLWVGALIVAFLLLAVAPNLEAPDLGWRALGDDLPPGPIALRYGYLEADTTRELMSLPRLLTSLFVHLGPWSLVVALLMGARAARLVETAGGRGYSWLIFGLAGAVGNAAQVELALAIPRGVALPCGAFAGVFGLLGAQAALRRRGALSGAGLRGRGILGGLFSLWIVSSFRLGVKSLDINAFAPILLGMLAAALCGAFLAWVLPATADDPGEDIPTEPLTCGCLLALLGLSLLVLAAAAPALVERSPGTLPITRTEAPAIEPRALGKFDLQVAMPPGWVSLREDEGYIAFGTESGFGLMRQEELLVLSRRRHAFDAADTLVGRFLSMTASDFGLTPADLTLITDEPYEHPLGDGHIGVFTVDRSNLYVRTGVKRVVYVLTEDDVLIFLMLGTLPGEDPALCDAIVRSAALVPEDKDGEDGADEPK